MTTKVMGKNIEIAVTSPPVCGLKPFNRWCRENGITRATGWRWRNDGVIETVNIYGRQYVTREEEQRFQHRVESGEFYREAKPPLRADNEIGGQVR
jgi:hypothetical protein